MTFEEAKRFLQEHYCSDVIDDDKVRSDDEHWERVSGDPLRFPNADVSWIEKFGDAATTYLALR